MKMKLQDIVPGRKGEEALDKQRAVALAASTARQKKFRATEETMPDSMNMLGAFEADSRTASQPAKAVLLRVAEMARLMRAAQVEVATAEAELLQRKARLFKIASEDLPSLLKEAGVEDLTLEDGTKVSVAEEISCSITDEKRAEAHKWLRANNFGSIVKTQVLVSFGKDELAAADDLYLRMLKKYGDDHAEMKENVHPQTLKAFLKELMQDRVKFPLPLFGVHPYSMAKLTVKKEKGR